MISLKALIQISTYLYRANSIRLQVRLRLLYPLSLLLEPLNLDIDSTLCNHSLNSSKHPRNFLYFLGLFHHLVWAEWVFNFVCFFIVGVYVAILIYKILENELRFILLTLVEKTGLKRLHLPDIFSLVASVMEVVTVSSDYWLVWNHVVQMLNLQETVCFFAIFQIMEFLI